MQQTLFPDFAKNTPMKAAYFDAFQHPLRIENLPDPEPPEDGVVIKVKATGLCLSDWHGWMGHDADISLPHVPGHELAGIVVAKGRKVKHWEKADRVTLPFCMGCGYCHQCQSGNQQICDRYYQPGFTGWGSFAEYVAVPYADQNLVRLPENLAFQDAALLGCRFITAYRALVAQAQVKAGQWVAVHGCGGVGLSAILIAVAAGARVIAIDILDDKLELAKKIGAVAVLNARKVDSVPEALTELSKGGVQISVDALGSSETCINSILSLAKSGKHIQIGLMTGKDNRPSIPMGPIISRELEIIGSHGMQAHQYPGMLELINSGRLNIQQLLGKTVSLEESLTLLENLNTSTQVGITVINRF